MNKVNTRTGGTRLWWEALAVAGLGVGALPTAMAQEQPAAQQAENVEEVVVTGYAHRARGGRCIHAPHGRRCRRDQALRRDQRRRSAERTAAIRRVDQWRRDLATPFPAGTADLLNLRGFGRHPQPGAGQRPPLRHRRPRADHRPQHDSCRADRSGPKSSRAARRRSMARTRSPASSTSSCATTSKASKVGAQIGPTAPTSSPSTRASPSPLGGNFAEGRGNVVVSINYFKRDGITRGERGDWAGHCRWATAASPPPRE